MKKKIFDTIIIGCGPGGISSAIYLKKLERKIAIIGKLDGQLMFSGQVENYLGFNSITGLELYKNFFQMIKFNKIEFLDTIITKLTIYQQFITLTTKNNKKLYAKTILITTGTKYKKLNLKHENEFFNKGIYNCAICDGYLFKNKKVIILGGGNTALDSSLILSKICKNIVLINKNKKFKGEKELFNKVQFKKNVNIIYNSLCNKILIKNNKIYGVEFYNKTINKTQKIINFNAIFINIGMEANTQFIKNIINLNKFNEIIVNKNFNTNIKRIFAAGDVTNNDFKQAIIAAGDGTKAALYINRFLNSEII